ncbi:TetR/AcrR family transcriptional regulator [Apilactobacillus kunkeei]|nr:TetR/AcrR family transcriptional regulator [Apilactobacillus kunkeei]
MQIKSKTKEKIIKTFLNLSANEDVSEIGTSTIIAVSGVSRGTFYNHFKNKKDILEHVEKMLCKSIDEVFKKTNPNDDNYVDKLMDEIFPIIYDDREYNNVLYLYHQSEFFDFITERYSKYFQNFLKTIIEKY